MDHTVKYIHGPGNKSRVLMDGLISAQNKTPSAHERDPLVSELRQNKKAGRALRSAEGRG